MIKCPNCNASLPDSAGSCQFCQAVWAPQAGSPGKSRSIGGMNIDRPETWTKKAYYAVAAWWTVSGIWSVLQATAFATKDNDGGGFLAIAFGAITALVGLGLLLKVEAVRNVVVIMAAFNILFGLLGLVTAVFFTFVGGFWGALMVIHEVVDIALAGLMIFLIGETDTRAPNY
jgi:hypothetical protein